MCDLAFVVAWLVGEDRFIDRESYSECWLERYQLLFCEGYVYCLVECQIAKMKYYL